MKPLQTLIAGALLAVIPPADVQAQAQGPGGYPAKPITQIVPFAPGGAPDV